MSDPSGTFAQPHPFLENNPAVFSKLGTLLADYDVSRWVIGLPKTQNGEESSACEKVRAFAQKVMIVLSIQMEFWDERYSTKAATSVLIEGGVSRKNRKQKIDSQAAAFILQGYLDRQQRIKNDDGL